MLFRGPAFSRDLIDRLNAQFGLDQPLWIQYIRYLENTLTGNLGVSYTSEQPVSALLFPRLVNSLILVLTATVLSIIIGIAIGIICAWRRGGNVDIALSASTLLLYSMPTFWLGLVLLFLGVVYFGLPVAGMTTLGVNLSNPLTSDIDFLSHLILPCSTLVLGLVGQFVLVMRNSLLDVFTEDYMLTARAKSISNRKLLVDHALRNAVLPVVTLAAINLGLAVGGAIQTETVFSWPGIGLLIYQALLSRDYPVLQGCFLVIAIAVVLANFAAEITYGYLDPRVRAK